MTFPALAIPCAIVKSAAGDPGAVPLQKRIEPWVWRRMPKESESAAPLRMESAE